MKTAYIETPIGILELTGSTEGLVSVIFKDDGYYAVSQRIPAELQSTVKQLQDYFEGKTQGFNIKLSLEGTSFQKKVWNQLLKIPFGKTITYSQMAAKLGDPKVIRAAASANGKNPIPIIVPCHRIIGSDGSLTGYAGGLDRKKWLLEHESPPKQMVLSFF